MFISDSLTTVQCLQVGRHVCSDGKVKYARVYLLCCDALEETPADRLVWMPAHQAGNKVWVSMWSDGRLLTELDRSANGLADKMAKEAVEFHRVDQALVEVWTESFSKAVANAKRLAKATHEANNQEAFPSGITKRHVGSAKKQKPREGRPNARDRKSQGGRR